MDFIQKFERSADSIFGSYVNDLARKYNVPRSYLSSAIGIFLILFIFVGLGASLFSLIIGIAFPAYSSFKAIESPDTRDDTQWLTYWVVFAVFSILEVFTDTLIYWFPLYYSAKILFLLWCQVPLFNGAELLYKRFIRPTFLAYQPLLDQYFHTVSTLSTHVVNNATTQATNMIANNMANNTTLHNNSNNNNSNNNNNNNVSNKPKDK